ncbi:hypothetical protein MSMTP_2955 [Methanosarcina sp. MTP4]|uniref:hypothetical protein n=1 Tax=Methanosarcina sp. MTP4 TaxID=1434100 RepID=UPI000615BD3F|nr:hypothetical protein [Methanosarcina sp. MTP4]AKB26424.1 hypothetical protein MSMTP_2955 [Methanosarcina sp. MTP4]
MNNEVYAASMAAISSIQNITNDRIEALTKGHGMTNIGAMCAANAIATELFRGANIQLTDEDSGSLQIDQVLEKGIEAAKEAGASPANAALFAASICYFAGSNAQAGVPAGNRKIGALARMIAGADRTGVISVPTPKSNNKVSGFAAVQAIYKAMEEGKLTRIDGRKLPLGVAGGPLYGHNTLGEDIGFPEVAMNAAKVGTEAMMKAYWGAGVSASPIISAIIGTAASLEIVHPDAFVGAEYGGFFDVNSAYLAGKAACEVAGIPEKLHMRGTGEEYDSARLVGDLGVIIKDIGAPTVVGMMSFGEMLCAFQESVQIGAGFSGGPIMPPLGHMTADCIIALRALIKCETDVEKAADIIAEVKKNEWLDPEIAAVALNTISRKTEQVRRGLVTRTMILGTDGVRSAAIFRRAQKTYDALKAGKTVEDVVREIDVERKTTVETRAAAMLGAMTGHELKIEIKKLVGGARRDHPFTNSYYGFDTDADVDVTVDGKKFELKGLGQTVIPDAIFNDKQDILEVIPLAAIPVSELQLSGHSIINITVPAAVAAAMKVLEPKEAAKLAEKGGKAGTAAIPGAREKAFDVAKLAVRIMDSM